MERPMTSWPCSASRAAATDESTPPDIATTMRIIQKPRDNVVAFLSRRRSPGQRSQLLDNRRQQRGDPVDLFFGREHSQAESQGVLRPVRRKAHGAEDMRRLQCP